MSTASDTPRTDEARRMAFSYEYMVPTEFAKTLERNLIGATSRESYYKAKLEEALENLANLKHELDEMEQSRDHYRASVSYLKSRREVTA